jgi:hypothetical protein
MCTKINHIQWLRRYDNTLEEAIHYCQQNPQHKPGYVDSVPASLTLVCMLTKF